MVLVCKQWNNENIVDIKVFSIFVDICLIFALLIEDVYVSVLVWKKKWQAFDI